MNKIKWCMEQNKGIELVEPNNNLSDAYIKDADDSLNSMQTAKGMWRTVMAYYACYFSLYSLLMKVGIKCEIHDCTLALMEVFDFDIDKVSFIKKLKKERIDVQYYHREPKDLIDVDIKSFILFCKTKIDTLSLDDINKLREVVRND